MKSFKQKTLTIQLRYYCIMSHIHIQARLLIYNNTKSGLWRFDKLKRAVQ